MQYFSFISENMELFKFLYSLIVILICVVIVLKTNKLFKLSLHQGIRYFRNAFFFYGFAFVLRYMLTGSNYFILMKGIFQFFIIMGGFFLLYSLLWRKFENNKGSKSSFFNPIIVVFYLITLIVVLLDYFWGTYNFMFFSQIILFGLASMISFKNYLKKGKKRPFPRLYFIVMIFSFFAWSFNFIFTSFVYFGRLRWIANVYGLNIIVFLIFLYGVIKVTKKKD